MIKKRLLVFFSIVVVSCNYFEKVSDPQIVARVGDAYLYSSELDSLISKNTSKEDSVVYVKSFVNRWVTQKLLSKAAERNLDEAKKEEFNILIRKYKNDLYTKAYIEKIVTTTLDTLIDEEELKQYYKENKENFKTNGTLLQLRYLHVS